jgi:two-component system cell cycle response regulator
MSPIKLPTLLAVTDNPSVRFWIKKHLEEEFFIIEAADKKGAISAAQSALLDFIIVDSEFEDCDPLELCLELKKILRSLVPILLITGRLKKSYLDAALEAGVTDFLNNQLDPEELQVRIATIRRGQALRGKTQEASSALMQKREDFSSTYLKNRVLLHNQAIKLLEEAKQEQSPVAALILHIDHFNELQSRIGYLMSEHILIPFTNLIQTFISKKDLLIPSGEGRFILLMPNTNADHGRALAERIRKEILKATFPTSGGPVQLTVSIVVASLEGGETEFNQMVDSSFKALKTAKDLIISIDKENL